MSAADVFCVRALLANSPENSNNNNNNNSSSNNNNNSDHEDSRRSDLASTKRQSQKRPRADSSSDPSSLSTPSTSTTSATSAEAVKDTGGDSPLLRSLCDSLKRRVSDDLGRIVDALMLQLVRNLAQSRGHAQPPPQLPRLPPPPTHYPPIFYPPYPPPSMPPPPPPYFWPVASTTCWPLDPAAIDPAVFCTFAEAAETPKKKRAKVTDIRGGQQSLLFDPCSRSSTPNLGGADALAPSSDLQGLESSGDSLERRDPHDNQIFRTDHFQTTTLTPMHLRKAKLMFFYTRYPNTGALRLYFPDVQLNKGNTAQVVKWFSNFREFFYIQVEKFARQALAAGCAAGDQQFALVGSRDCELFRILNSHFNRNGQFQVPSHFACVVGTAVREFYSALAARRDQDQSWKKSIYKVVARLDCSPPECFKQANWPDRVCS